MNILFICNQNENRSKTAAKLFSNKFKTKSAGLYSKKKVSSSEISWSNVIIVMEEEQRSELAKRFPKQYLQKRILSFDIPDIYHYQQPSLIKQLNIKFGKYKNILR